MTALRKADSPATAGNEQTGLLKIIALACMVIDHVGQVFFPQIVEMRLIGRMAFPLYAWCLVVGAEYTRSPARYALRLLAVGALSQPLYALAFHLPWQDLNIFFGLLMGLLGIIALREQRWGSQFWGPVLAVLTGCALKIDYDWRGILLILLMYGCRKSRGGLAALMTAFCLFWSQTSTPFSTLLGVPVTGRWALFPYGNQLFFAFCRLQFWAILALPLMLIPMKSRLRLPKWAYYAAYPAHLLLIVLLRR